MDNQSLSGIIRKQAVNRLRGFILLSLLLAVLCLIIVFAADISIPGIVKSPAALDVNATVMDIANGEYVSVTTEWLYDIDIQETTTSENRTSVSGYYGVVEFMDGYIVCLLHKDDAENLFAQAENGSEVTISGRLQEFESHDSGLIRDLVSDLNQAYGATIISADDFSPYLLQAKSNHHLRHRVIAGAVALFILFMFLRGLMNIRFITDYRQHRLYKALDMLGDPERLEYTFDACLTSGRLIVESRNIYISPDIILCVTGNGGWARRTSDLFWTYKKTVQHRTNGIPTGKTVALVMYFKRQSGVKDKHDIREAPLRKEKDADAAVASVESKLPAVMTGYDARLETMYKKEYEHFEAEHRRYAAEQGRPAREAPAESAEEPADFL